MGEIKQFTLEPSEDEAGAIAETTVATTAMMLALKTLSQRAIAAVKDIFTLASVGACFWLFLSIPSPNTFQLVELGMFSIFVLAANWIVRRVR